MTISTIKDRAFGYACTHGQTQQEEDAYEWGATEQREIDIDKACEWLRENVRPYYKFSIDSFRKAMEEEQ